MRTSHQKGNPDFYRLALGVLGIVALAFVVTAAEGQGSRSEEGYAATSETVEARESFWIEFTVNAQAEIRFEYKVESGRQLDLYIMTEAQFQRAKARAEPTKPGRDFIRHARAITGQGSEAENLRPGRYAIVFRNLDSKPIRVWTQSTAIRQ